MILPVGIGTILLLLILILSKRISALSALILVPIAGALIAGFGAQTFEFALAGIRTIAPVVAMFVFAILFFGVLTDAGMFDPIIDAILRFAGNSPAKLCMGTALLAMIVHLDGSGAVTFIVTIPAMLPLFDKIGIDRRILACVVALGAGTMNLVPWGGPTIRAATALNVGITDLYRPVLIPQLAGLVLVLAIAWFLGRREAKRLGISTTQIHIDLKKPDAEVGQELKRPKLFWINILLTLVTIIILVSAWAPPALIFMVATIVALSINYPRLKLQKERIDAHAKAALLMASILLAAGVFTGIMTQSGMVSAMAEAAAGAIPESAGGQIPVIMAVTSMPLSLVFDPDSFYFGFLPIISQVAGEFGVAPVAVGQAAILGQMTTGFPLSPLTATTFLLTGLTGVDLGDHQRFTFGYAFLVTLLMTSVSILVGTLPI